MNFTRVLLALGILGLGALSFWVFPGHTILQSDTQIYLPIMEHLWDPGVLAHDLVAEYPHVSFTIYDEVLLLLRKITGAGFEPLLLAQQFTYRLLGIAGLFLVGTAVGLGRMQALLLAAIASLGATITGPAVLTVEYEPVPRGFALAFVLFALGLVAHDRWDAAAIFAGLGFLFHPPTALPFLLIYLGVALWRGRIDVDALLAGVVAVMFAFVVAQRAFVHTNDLFVTIPPWLEKLQRMRASYNWVDLWPAKTILHFLLFFALGAVAFRYIRGLLPQNVAIFSAALPAFGLLGILGSYLFLTALKLMIMAQLQPGRYLLFVTLMGVVISGIAAMHACAKRQYLYGFLFFLLCYLAPLEDNFLSLSLLRVLLAAGLAALSTLACSVPSRWAAPLLATAAIVPFLAIPMLGKVRNYAVLHTANLDKLVAWSKASTSADAMFQFADFDKRLEPGVLRARAMRAIYADWKAGGQVNYMQEFAGPWWERWQQVATPKPFEQYKTLGIDYVVYQAAHRLKDRKPVYENDAYVVYATNGPTETPRSLSGSEQMPARPGASPKPQPLH